MPAYRGASDKRLGEQTRQQGGRERTKERRGRISYFYLVPKALIFNVHEALQMILCGHSVLIEKILLPEDLSLLGTERCESDLKRVVVWEALRNRTIAIPCSSKHDIIIK